MTSRLQTESTVVHAVELSSVELSCDAINGPLSSRQPHCSDVVCHREMVGSNA